MAWILPLISFSVKQRLCRHLRRCRHAATRLRYLIILNLANGRSAYQTAAVLGVHNTTVYRVARRFREHGEWGLWDGREDNGLTKVDERYLVLLYQMVCSTPQRHGWRRPTWTRAMLVETLAARIGVRVHVATLSRALKLIGARRGRPRPVVRCPWSPAAKARRLKGIRRLLATLPAGHVGVYEDEVDIHLNPKLGWDWMVPGQQKEVVTPGCNVKRYLAGALDARSRHVVWVEGARKTGALFVSLLDRLAASYPQARVIHVVLDNYRIHTSRLSRAAVAAYGGRIRLHFLPPYCPLANKMDRVWQDLHANVTRHHTCPNMDMLMFEVDDYLSRRNRRLTKNQRSPAA